MSAVEQETIPSDKHRMLIVDDERAIRAVFKQVLSYNLPHCRMDVAVNGAEAVEFFRTVHHGVVLMDLKMPVMDGETAFGKIEEICKEEGWEMPAIIFCTGYSPSSRVKDIVDSSDANHLLHKPVPSQELLQVLKAHLEEASGD